MSKLKNTNTKEFKATVFAYLCNALYDFEGTPEERATRIWEKFSREYDYPDNRKRIPNLQARVAEWLSGLPLNVDYSYFDVRQTSQAWHECELTEKQADMVCANWFNFLAFKTLQLWQSVGIDPFKGEC